MKLSQAIQELQRILAEHGDKEIYEGAVFGKHRPINAIHAHRDPEQPYTALVLWTQIHADVREVPA